MYCTIILLFHIREKLFYYALNEKILGKRELICRTLKIANDSNPLYSSDNSIPPSELYFFFWKKREVYK